MDSSSSDSVPSTQSTDKGCLWEYVTKVSRTAETGGTWKIKCNFCNETKQGSFSRVRAHLIQLSRQGIATCKKVNPTDLLEMKTKDTEYENIVRKENLTCLYTDTRSQLDQEIARMFYTGGLSFNLARNPYYWRSFTFVANQNLSGYVPPSYNKLRMTLVQLEKANVERLLQPIKDTWKEKGVSIVTDGWSDPQRRPLINFMAASAKGPMFIEAVNCMSEIKTKEFIANLMKEVINEITNNAAN
ncbi:hAT dimerization domain, ribonuclease H-like domain protein [Tanacetum coccineum]